jgi:hypothetical protein
MTIRLIEIYHKAFSFTEKLMDVKKIYSERRLAYSIGIHMFDSPLFTPAFLARNFANGDSLHMVGNSMGMICTLDLLVLRYISIKSID